MRVGGLALTVAAIAPIPGRGAEWYAAPRVSQDLGYDTNVRLDSNDSESAVTSVSRIGVTVGGRSPALDLRLDAQLNYSAYLGGGPANTDSEYVSGGFTRQASPRTSYGLTGSFVRDTSIDDVLDDTGQQQRTDDPRYTFGLTPFASHELTALDTGSANASWQQREDTSDDGVNFTTLSSQVGWLRTVTRRLRLGGNLYGNYYDSDRQESWLASPRLSAVYSGSEVLDFNISLGPSIWRTETSDDNAGVSKGSETQLGVTADGTATLRLSPVTSTALTLSHYLEPSGDTGDLSETTRAALSLSHRLSPRLSADAALLAQRQVRVQSDTGDDRDFFQAGGGLAYALTERFDVGLRYRWRHESGDDDATSNAVFVTLAYRFPEWRTSW